MFKSPVVNFEDRSLKNFFVDNYQPMVITDAEFGTVLEINASAAKISGFNKEEIILQSVEKIIPKAEKNKVLLLENNVAEQTSIKKEIALNNSFGKAIFVEAIVSPILFDNKEARLIVMNDITEKKLFRNLLEEATEQEIDLRDRNQKLEKLAYINRSLVRKPLANILGLVNVLDLAVIADKTLFEAIEFLKESSNELDTLLKGFDPEV